MPLRTRWDSPPKRVRKVDSMSPHHCSMCGAPGSLVGLVTSLGNTFWNPCISAASNNYVEDNQGVYRNTSDSDADFFGGASVSAQTATATVSGPSTVSDDAFLSTGGQIQSCFAKNRDWVFYISYADGRLYYKSAPDATTWTSNVTIGSQGTHGSPLETVQAVCTAASVYLVYASGTNNEFYYAAGTFRGTTITFTVLDKLVVTDLTADISLIPMNLDSAGNLWVAPRVSWYSFDVYELPATDLSSGQGWTLMRPSNPEISLSIVPLLSGKMAVIYSDTSSFTTFSVITWSGSSWSSPVTFANAHNSCDNDPQSCTATAIGDTVYMPLGTMSGTHEILLYNFTYGAGTWAGPSTIVTLDSHSIPDATITTNGTALIVAYDTEEASSGVDYCTSTDAGSTWACTGVFAADEDGPHFVGGSTFMAGGTAWGVTWITSTGCPPSLCSPYTLRYSSLAPASSSVTTPDSCTSSASLEPSLPGQWNENAEFPSSKCGNALYCAYNSGYDFCVTDSYPESSAVFGQVVGGRISTWEGMSFSACSYPEPFCRPGTNGEVVDCTSYSGYMYCVDQVGDWTSSPLTTGGFGNWTILGDANNALDSVAESCGAVGSRMACLTELGWEYTFPLNSTGGTGMPSECIPSYGGYDWFHNPACDSIWIRGNAGGSSACVGTSAGLECQAGTGGSYPDTYWLNDTLLYPVNSTGFILDATVVGPAFGASIIPHDAEVGFYQGPSCVFVSVLYCLGGYDYNQTSGSPYSPFNTFGDLTSLGWDYLNPLPFGVYSPGARVDETCCSWSPSAGTNLVTDGSTFVLGVGGVVNANYPRLSTNESYSYLFPAFGGSCPPGQFVIVANSTTFACGASPSGSATLGCGAPPSSSTTTTTILNSEGNWTSYVPVWVLNSTVPWGSVYNVFVSTSGLVIVQAGANGLYRVGLTGAITQLSSGWSYPPDTIPISDSSAHGTYVITEVTWSSPPEILVMKNGSLLQTLTVAEGISGYTVMDISADGQFIVFVGNPYIELFQGQGRT